MRLPVEQSRDWSRVWNVSSNLLWDGSVSAPVDFHSWLSLSSRGSQRLYPVYKIGQAWLVVCRKVWLRARHVGCPRNALCLLETSDMRLSKKVSSGITRAVASGSDKRDVQEGAATDRMLLCIVVQLVYIPTGETLLSTGLTRENKMPLKHDCVPRVESISMPTKPLQECHLLVGLTMDEHALVRCSLITTNETMIFATEGSVQ